MADRSPNLIDNVTPTPALAASPFGPVRKREKPAPGIPGQRKPADNLPPRPAPPTSVFNPDPKKTASWWDHAEQFLSGQQPEDRIGQPAAWGAFRDDVPAGAA